MARSNLTLQLDADLIKRARIVAAKRGTSVSALAAKQLIELIDEDDRYEQARERAEAILGQATPRGGRTWTRADLHDRSSLAGR